MQVLKKYISIIKILFKRKNNNINKLKNLIFYKYNQSAYYNYLKKM